MFGVGRSVFDVDAQRPGMSSFWEGMAAGNDAAITTMGEAVALGGVDLSGVVEPQSFQEGAASGGRKTIINCKVLVPAGTVLRDGMSAVLRGAEGKVESWEMLGPDGHLMVQIGPKNRWSGEVPGV